MSLAPVVLGGSAAAGAAVSAVLRGGGGATSRGVRFSEADGTAAGADCNVIGCLASPAGNGAATDASGFAGTGAAVAGVELAGAGGTAIGAATCTGGWATGSYLLPMYPASAALTPKITTNSASERRCTVLLLE